MGEQETITFPGSELGHDSFFSSHDMERSHGDDQGTFDRTPRNR